MKKQLLFLMFALYSSVALSATVTIINSGFEFSPDDISINVGDTVVFDLEDIHNAVEVSEATWLVNGNTPLPGFSVAFGGGVVVGLTAGIHYYVCAPHASGGMKGTITVNPSAGIGDPVAGKSLFELYPNPTTGKFSVKLMNEDQAGGKDILSLSDLNLEVYNLVGDKTFDLRQSNMLPSNEIDLSAAPAGVYFVRLYFREKVYTRKLVIQ